MKRFIFYAIVCVTLINGCNTQHKLTLETKATSTVKALDGGVILTTVEGEEVDPDTLVAAVGLHTQQIILSIHKEDMSAEKARISGDRWLWTVLGTASIFSVTLVVITGLLMRSGKQA